jgi:fructan beta-fructosidase
MHLYFDVASVELFADGGVTTLTDIFFATEPFDRIALFAEGGTVVMAGGEVWALRGIW